MAIKESNFVLDLCIGGQVPPFYDTVLRNKITGVKIHGEPYPPESKTNDAIVLVTDLPDYLEAPLSNSGKAFQLLQVPQYEGYMIDLKKFDDIQGLINTTFSRNPRKNLRAKIRNLEAQHEVTYAFYFGDIDKTEYDYLFDVCYALMKIRFDQKKLYNRYLLEWKKIYDLFYSKIVAKEASIGVIYDANKPITVTLNFHKADIVFSYIQIYDVAYYKFSMGDIAMLKNLEWSFENGFAVWDVSKGATENKLRWSNHIYRFNYHLFYQRNSILSKIRANWILNKLVIKQWLRNKGIIGDLFQLDKVYYYTRRRKINRHNWKN
jgi:hypothetical protein